MEIIIAQGVKVLFSLFLVLFLPYSRIQNLLVFLLVFYTLFSRCINNIQTKQLNFPLHRPVIVPHITELAELPILTIYIHLFFLQNYSHNLH